VPICDNCGMGLPVGYEYCFKCGYPVRGPPPGDPAASPAAATPPFGYPAAPSYGAPAATVRTQVLAAWNARFAAALIDYMLVSVGAAVVVYLSGAFGGTQDLLSNLSSTSGPKMELVGAVMASFFAYNVICEAVWHATLGKRVLGLRVVAYGGGPAGLAAIVLRNLTKVASCLVWVVGVPLALATIATNPNHQRLGDRLAQTYVLRDVVTFVAPGAPR
jgi:uncharacterized RDD family membrane protein YckC